MPKTGCERVETRMTRRRTWLSADPSPPLSGPHLALRMPSTLALAVITMACSTSQSPLRVSPWAIKSIQDFGPDLFVEDGEYHTFNPQVFNETALPVRIDDVTVECQPSGESSSSQIASSDSSNGSAPTIYGSIATATSSM